jgi:hypothetical protein
MGKPLMLTTDCMIDRILDKQAARPAAEEMA